MTIAQTHPLYDRHLADWRFYLAAWQGTQALLAHGALQQHPRETLANFRQRQRQAVSFNYSRSIVDIFLHYLFEKPGQRDVGPLADDPLYRAFLADTDLYGTDYDLFWYEAQQYAAILGHVGILVTKSPTTALSRADELAAGLHPYYALYLPTAILDWQHGRDAHGRPVLERIKLRDDDGTIRLWTPDTWEVWQPANGTYERRAAGPNPLGRVPFVWHLNERGAERFIGVSDIQDVARLDVSIMRNLSQADEVIDLAAFPMLMLPRTGLGEEPADPAVGPRAVLDFDPALPDSKPAWLRAEVLEPIDAILRFIGLKVDEIYRMTNTRGEALPAGGNLPSGRALSQLFRQLNARLATKAAALDESELACLRLWLAWQQQETWSGNLRLRRPRDYNVDDLAGDLSSLLAARDLVASDHFRRQLQKTVARRVLPNLTEAQQARIDAEVEA